MNGNHQLVSQAFTRQSAVFDQQDANNKLTLHLRSIYRSEIQAQASPGARILELNCGTGIDSLYFAAKGYQVLSTDNAPGMLQALQAKIRSSSFQANIRAMRCSFENLATLGKPENPIKPNNPDNPDNSDNPDNFARPPFDHIISNFGGLNCTGNLAMVLDQFQGLLKDQGKITLVIMPKYAPWEWLMLLKGKGRTAFRRLAKHPTAHIEGVRFKVHYYNPAFIIRHLKKNFRVLTLRGIYFAVPPEFYKGFVERYPNCYRLLQKVEKSLGAYFPFNRCCDHYMITLQKKAQE